LRHRHFDRIHDYRSMPCDAAPSITTSKGSFSTLFWEYLDGIKDDCAVGALSDWLGEAASAPFFAVLWTHMTHYPYMLDGAETRYVRDKDQNRYLNALRSGDRGLGRLMERLDALGLADSTLVVVLGDHGEAFGRHGDRGHGSAVYEANIKIPLVFINRRLFRGETVDTVGGIVDIAPTVAQLIGVERGAHWQGRSLLAANRPERTYFFTPWGDLTFGFRDANMKYIFNATYNKLEIYDLASDPLETKDLSAVYPDRISMAKARLAAWVQFQDRFIRARAAPTVRSAKNTNADSVPD
jgi:lipoteichoic acid synthase